MVKICVPKVRKYATCKGAKRFKYKDALRAMVDSDQTSQNISCFDSDWNSNQFLTPDAKQTDQKSLDGSFFEQYSNIKDNANKDYYRKSSSSPGGGGSPTSAYGGVLHQKDLSYDDLSKNIDANLAEIDMETFRSEDINSILALPAIFSGGDFQTAGEQCASVSGSLLGGAMLELDASARSNRHSEDEISIIKDEPLFSPLREPPAQATISVDSLDNSSSYEQDLVLTCKANKNNYTIVFEGSSTQFSDDSDYQDHVCNSSSSNQSGVMAQSDVAFTTWSKLWKSHRVVSNRRKNSEVSKMTSSKSQSLPNLSHSSVLITDKQLSQWAKWCGHHQFPLYELVKMGATNKEGQQLHSISLLKLFMKHKVGGSSSIGSSTADSASSTSLIMQPLNYRNAVLQNSSSMSVDDNETTGTTLDNEANNNNNLLNSLYNNATETTTVTVVDNNNVAETECDNSQYFEDSLMDAPSPPLKHFHATPIKEEEETDISSGDEVMRENPFGSDESSSGEITVINNEAAVAAAPPPKSSNLEQRISNILPLKKPTTTTTESHATQTRQFNINECTGGEAFKPFSSCKTSSNQTDCDTPVTYTPSRDSSPASSGYVSSRHSSVERLRHSSSNVFTHNNNTTPQKNSSSNNVVLTTTCTCGTQIPVHVKDSSMQTSGLASSTSSDGFTLKESTSALPEPNNVSQQTSATKLSSHSSTSSQTGKPRSPKGNKSIYVCYPNYSLPDLSFLKSVIEENSESVFLAPTEYRLPQDMTPKRPSRPKSYTAYESMLQKHLTKIKDFESLNVLLPDDLKLLISKTKGGAVPKTQQQQQQQSMSSSFDGKHQHVPRSILRKSSSAEQQHQCEDGSRRCSSASDECKLLEGGFCSSKKVVESILPSFEAPRGCEVEEGGKKAVKFCERSPTKSSKLLDAACKSGRCCSCDNQNKTPESEKPPQEFLVSPTQNALIYPDISDSYTLQNFSGGGKFFQEALRRKTGLVENLRKAVQIIFEHHKNSNKKGMELSYSLGQKILTCLCPAVHTILSDGLLPSVQGFFGPLPNSPWKVAGASIKQGETRKDVEELLNHVTAEKLLTDSTYRFNAFILGLLNLGCFEWWLGHLCACQSLICHHYHPTALLSLLALPAAVHLRHELKELVSPLSNLPFHHLDILLETKSTSEHWKKYDEGNFRPELNFLQCTPCGRGKINDLCGVKSKVLLASPCSNVMNIHEEENQVWPGITINPFPNAEFCGGKKERNNQTTTKPSPLRDTLLPRGDDHPGGARRAAADTPLFSLCSSTDSGCSSQIQEHIANIANLNLTEEDKPEAKEFKMLRQKWEKMTTTAKVPPKSAPPSAAKPTISSTSKTKKRQEGLSAPKTPTKTPPSRRAQGGRFEPPKPLSSPEGTPSDEKRRSGIPMLKFGKPKSMIPTVQKPGLSRARSANRDARYPSD